MVRAPAGVRLGATNGQRRNLREGRWHRGRFSVEILLALAVGVVAFVLAATVGTAARGHVPAVLLGSLLLLAVVTVARFGGISYALPVGVMTILAFDWYFLPPLREFDAATALVGGLFLVMSVIVGAVATQAGRRSVTAERARADLAAEQVALRRVATLVASGARPAEVFTAVADQLAWLIGADATFFSRVDHVSAEGGEPEGEITVVGSYGRMADDLPVGFRSKLQSGMALTAAVRDGRPVRIGGELLAAGPFGAIADKLGIRAAVATSVVVGGRHWGVSVATSQEDFPAGAEARIVDFMELAAMAIANAQSEQKIRELADTQASLRRLAMLVAHGESPEAVFAAVTREVLRHFGNGTARMIRFELDGSATLLASEGTAGPQVRVAGGTWGGYRPTGLTATVLHTGQAARVDDFNDVPGGEAYLREGIRSAVAMPVHVHGRLWGLIAIGSDEGPLPPDAEQRMTEFTDLVATAVANAQSRAELMTSRARIVAASDEARRRIQRDLHDGAQQRLVALALKLRSAATSAECGEIGTEVEDVAADLLGVLDELREISRGIHPAILSEAGLRAALRALRRRSAVPVELDVRVEGRLPEPVEVAAYYVVSETLTNAAKHARASLVQVDAEITGDTLRVRVHDNGVGGADPMRGSGLVGLRDRIEALGGTLSLHSPPGAGTTVSSTLPLTEDGDHPAADPDA